MANSREKLLEENDLILLVKCPACGSKLSRTMTVQDFESATGEYGIDWCDTCAVYFTNPAVKSSSLYKLYQSRESSDFPSGKSLANFLRTFANSRYAEKILPSGTSNVKVLDWGCGDGNLALGLSKNSRVGCVTALDFHKVAPKLIKDEPKCTYISFEEFEKIDGQKFDLIVARHVLEHDTHTGDLVKQITDKLSDDGLFVAEVPVFDGVWAKIFKANFYSWYVPRHLIHFTVLGLSSLFSDDFQVRIRRAHTPILGGSMGNYLGRKISNLSVGSLALYPLQIICDALIRRSTTAVVEVRRLKRINEI